VESGYIEVDEGRLYYERTGAGVPIVLIHDGLVHHEIWDGQLLEFAKEYDVVRYDRRGYGKSPDPESTYSNVRDLCQLMDALNIENAHLIGMSSGGGLVIDFALEHPSKVRSMVLVGAVVRGFGYTNHFFTRGGRFSLDFYSNPDNIRTFFCQEDPYEIAPDNTAARERLKKLLNDYPHNADFKKHHLGVKPDVVAITKLSDLKTAALIVVGEHDIPDVHAHAGAIDAGISMAQRGIVMDAGHLVPMEQPEAFNELVLDFLGDADFFNLIASAGAEAAAEFLTEKLRESPDDIPFNQDRMNKMGYRFLYGGKKAEALALFKLNVDAYADSWNVYDSYAEALLGNGKKELAIEYYRKSLELNPENTNAIKLLEELQGE
jgi:pimeloyl-ACP methyl ester carboxylesterase